MNQKHGVCTFCGTGCGLFLSVESGMITRVFPSLNHPVSRGRLCVRGWNIHELLRTKERITVPMIRENGVLRECSYGEAIGKVADTLAALKSRPSEIGFLASPRAANEETYLFAKLGRAVFRTNNISLDSESGHRNSLNVMNEGAGFPGMHCPVGDIRKAEFVLVLGIDITKQNPIIGSEIHLAAQEGTRVVTIDSRRTQIAKLSNDFLHIHPGSNRLILGALAKAVIEQGLAAADFIASSVEGYDAFAAAVAGLTEDQIRTGTGISYDDIKKIARDLAESNTAMAFFSSGISGLEEETIRYLFNLFVITGKIGKEGSGVNPVAGLNNLQGGYDMGAAPDLLTGFQPLDDDNVRAACTAVWGAEPPAAPGRSIPELLGDPSAPLKALVVADHDEGIIRYAERLKEIDFVAYIGAFRNPFTDYADVIIPVASYIEADGTFTNTERRIQLSEKKVEAPEGVLPGWKVYPMIAEKAGTSWNYSSPADVMNEIAKVTPQYAGVSYERLRSRGISGIQWPCDDLNPHGTPFFSLDKMGRKLKCLPVSGDIILKKADPDYPMLLMAGKAQHYWHQNNLMKKTHIPLREYNATLLDYPEGFIEINSADSYELGVRDHWKVRVVSPSGSMIVAVKISDDVKPGTAYSPYFVQDMITKFLAGHTEVLRQGEDATIPVRIEKV
ncbi:MAG TPA: molybdopterin-dependent oxidoreductase [Spirochaetota bacterium]|nr:molybdopterin-dependent oxidoreductase [Spirochaetota bacterium]